MESMTLLPELSSDIADALEIITRLNAMEAGKT